MNIQTHWIKTQDHQTLFAKTWGDEKNLALVLVHGYPDNHEVWENIIEHLVDKYYIVTYDVRGAGQSSVPSSIKDYNLARLSLDLECVVDALLPNRPFHAAAHDWGSIQTWESVTEPKFKNRILSYTTISGPCLDHAAFWMRNQFKHQKNKFFKQLFKSWYIVLFQLPLIAPTIWHFLQPNIWGKILEQLEQTKGLPVNQNISNDGKHGIALYRANFLPRLTFPRQRMAICPVQAVVLSKDKYVSPELIDEIPRWANAFEKVVVDANHWAVISRAKEIAQYIDQFIQKN